MVKSTGGRICLLGCWGRFRDLVETDLSLFLGLRGLDIAGESF